MNPLLRAIVSADPEERDRSFFAMTDGWSVGELLSACRELEAFRRTADNLYARVRAAQFLFAAYRFRLMEHPEMPGTGTVPYAGVEDLLARRYEQALLCFLQQLAQNGPNAALCSALAAGYHRLAFQHLTDQVRKSVRASAGNRWMFRVGHADDHPIRLNPALLRRGQSQLYPLLLERTPVRLDLSHCGWSDIFFLGMDNPEGARVLNISVDLGVYGRDALVTPPIETRVRVIPEPLLRLTSIDLQVTKDIVDLRELFNFGNDYLSLLKAGIIASGLVPPSLEGAEQSLTRLLAQVIGPGMGMELVTYVHDIPKGSRLAVSTNLLASIISALMRATEQTASFTGPLTESDRRLVASRAILGEWLGGSGGGWQDSGGIWPGCKIITGVVAGADDPEYGVSRGRLLPRHRVLGAEDVHPEIAERLTNALVLVHGGLAQNVGPILEMVTERYLLRSEEAWCARQDMQAILSAMLETLKSGDMQALGRLTARNWDGPLKSIIPWVTNQFTETIIARAQAAFPRDYWGFLMLGGMSGGGMGFFVNPKRSEAFREQISAIMREAKRELEHALPFAIEPMVYRFGLNEQGTTSALLEHDAAFMPDRYYALQLPELVRQDPHTLSELRRVELDRYAAAHLQPEGAIGLLHTMVSHLFRVTSPASPEEQAARHAEADAIKRDHGFDAVQHEQLRADLCSGRIGLAHNRLPNETEISDVDDADVVLLGRHADVRRAGEAALREGRVAVLTLAGGVGSRWTRGAGVIKALSPFVQLDGRHRSFLEIHLAKTQRTARRYGASVPHIISTSFLTHAPIVAYLTANGDGYAGPRYLSPGQSVGQRLIPTVRDLSYLWEETAEETLDEQRQKVREAMRAAWLDWARSQGEGRDYVDNVAPQRFTPPGHWYEVPNLFRNGVLARVLAENPRVETLLLHNIDTLGVDLDPEALGEHLTSGHPLTYEVTPRRLTDRGGGLARVNGRLRLLEGLAQPRDEDEARLRFYNSMTTWIQIDPVLAAFGLTREDLAGPRERIDEAVRRMAQRVPTYVTIKEVKRRWGYGQEDVFPVLQFEKLWGDMTSLPTLSCGYLAVPRARGQQLKDPDELDAWVQDGSRDAMAALCDFAGAGANLPDVQDII